MGIIVIVLLSILVVAVCSWYLEYRAVLCNNCQRVIKHRNDALKHVAIAGGHLPRTEFYCSFPCLDIGRKRT